ncbi:hypothetical protein EJ08DRAFT_644599 [Tothia fuscella]|uniref:Extracellular serine-rich protein n=1 Tax=Tothia fuscella TaxID=1048955 RepID=A0A9P4P435_9PEZI|nr:hypothetical protein EJ08DRAFT_644599 [Tothia fuscella]
MVGFTSFALIGAAAIASAMPTGTTYTPPTGIISAGPNAATHRVIAGFNGLRFEPENIVAEVGDLVEVHFNPMNHSFAQSSFAEPCKPINDNAIFSGFMPTPNGENPNVFSIVVQDKQPLWFYCSQTKGDHCQTGMSMVVNQNFNGAATLSAYKAKAALTGTSISPPRVQGGVIAPPKNGPGL